MLALHNPSLPGRARVPGVSTHSGGAASDDASETPLVERGRPRLASPRTSVLIVDDCVDTADSLALLLSLKGYTTSVLYSAARLRAEVLLRKPDLILLDIVMPLVSGYDAAEELRSDPAFDRIWLVAMTGQRNHRDVRSVSDDAFDGHLIKPVDFDALDAILRTARSERRSRSARGIN